MKICGYLGTSLTGFGRDYSGFISRVGALVYSPFISQNCGFFWESRVLHACKLSIHLNVVDWVEYNVWNQLLTLAMFVVYWCTCRP